MNSSSFLAFDLGAESGRAILGDLRDGRLHIKEIHRFPNHPFDVRGHLHWNILSLFEEVKNGMKACLAGQGVLPASCSVDTWGVDFGLLAGDGSLLGFPYSYRDPRGLKAMDEALLRLPRETIYQLTGIQFLPFNTLFQLYAMVKDDSPLLDCSSDLLFMPDLFHYLLTGVKATEFTIATTSQLFNPLTRGWAVEIFETLTLPMHIMQEVIRPATLIGPLDPRIASETGFQNVQVVASAGHDTAAAIAAVPAAGRSWAYISSGTWSLMGIELKAPILTQDALRFNFTNEGGLEDTTRFLKNIAGLWLLQQCRKEWDAAGRISYEELARSAETAPPFQALIDPDWPEFLNPESMTSAITRYCRKTGQEPPSSKPEFVRAILESMALKYRQTLEELEQTTSQSVDRIHVIGGGSRNRLLCRFTAEATGRPVMAGPSEATAVGNILGQALALGHVRSLAEIREISRKSTDLTFYEPRQTLAWEAAYQRFRHMQKSAS